MAVYSEDDVRDWDKEYREGRVSGVGVTTLATATIALYSTVKPRRVMTTCRDWRGNNDV